MRRVSGIDLTFEVKTSSGYVISTCLKKILQVKERCSGLKFMS